MTYQETLDYLFTRLPMFTRIGKAAYKADLNNTIALCRMLDNPETGLRAVHIAGTNGKGSVSHMIASILQEAGYRTGLYTSPHLKDFRERIRINGKMIPEEFIVDFVLRYREHFEEIDPSFFEWSVALCFHYFRAEKTDVAVVETGLGGRLDSTNVIRPMLSVITNIGLDHTDLLGSTLQLIAAEKAGIIKEGVPAIVGEASDETRPVFMRKAAEVAAPLTFTNDRYELRNFSQGLDGISGDIWLEGQCLMKAIHTDLGGLYQQNNLLTATHAISELRAQGLDIPEAALRRGLEKVKDNTGLAGRWMILGNHPLIVCDTGHNAHGMRYVLKQIKMQAYMKLHFVIGMAGDKNIDEVLSMLPREATYYFCNAALPRALPASTLKSLALLHELNGESYASVSDAFGAAKRNAHADDMIFIGGSTFVVAEIL